MGRLCDILTPIGLVSFIIGLLGYFGLLAPMEEGLHRALTSVRSKLDLSLGNVAEKSGSVALAAVWVILALLVIPPGLVELSVLFATRFHPTSLIYNPQFGAYALIPGVMFLVICVVSSKVRRWLFRGDQANARPFYSKLFINAYGFVLAALLLPWAIFEVFGTVMPTELIILLLIMPVLWFYAYGFAVLAMAIFGVLWLLVVVPYVLFHALSIPPQGAIATIGVIFSCMTFSADYFGLCEALVRSN